MRRKRVAEHVKAQNGTAVVLDFLIVVAGAFVGVQVNEWWLARLDARKERTHPSPCGSRVFFERVLELSGAAVPAAEPAIMRVPYLAWG